MKVGVPKEIHPGERRVAVVPRMAAKLAKLGLDVAIESGAGHEAAFTDQAYAEAGARIVHEPLALWAESDLILKVRAPEMNTSLGRHEADLLREGGHLISFLWPAQNKDLLAQLARRKATALAMDSVPRITRAQKLDALSAMANIAGYRAVIESASLYGRFLGGQITAAGSIRPATVLVLGAGVAGLAAVGCARSLGAIVKAFDTRELVREQVESLGGQFITFAFGEKGEGEGEGGYAKEMSDAYLAAEQEFIAGHAKDADIVITTALIPGKPAPQLLTSGAVVSMRTGSVVVDLAAEQGGNCALTERDRVVVRYGVTIIGWTDLTSRLPRQASELYSANIANLLEDVMKDGAFTLDLGDEVQRAMLVLKSGELMWPPPRVEVRAAAPLPAAAIIKSAGAEKPHRSPWVSRMGLSAAAVMLAALGVYAPPALVPHLTVFLLACVVGYHVVWNVTPALHTPLMSVTNAISGIIVIGGMLLTAGPSIVLTSVLAAIAVLVSSINIAGGFLVTHRMLKMFRR